MSSLLVVSMRKIHVLGNCFLSQRPLAERILDWIYDKLDILLFYRPFSGSELLPYGNKAWFRYLFSPSSNDMESFSSIHDLRGGLNQLNVYSVALLQQPASGHFTLLGFLVGVAVLMALVGLHLWAGNEAAQSCPTSP